MEETNAHTGSLPEIFFSYQSGLKKKKGKNSRYFKQKKFNKEISCLLMYWNGLRYSQISKNAITTGLQGEMAHLTKLGNQNILPWQ